jgi:2-dehydropantoate 2-reductase
MARIAIVGPGAVGSIMAGWLGRSGEHEVLLCARRPLGPLRVETPTETFPVRATVLTDPAAAPPVDWVLFATKTYDVPGAAQWLNGLAAHGAPVAVFQNGVEQHARLSPYVAPEKILPVLIYCPAERAEAGLVRQRRDARLVVSADALGRGLAALFAGTGVQVDLTADLTTALWEKLCVNAAGAINALLLKPAGVFADTAVAELARALVRECIAVGRAEGARLDDAFAEYVLELYRKTPADSVNSLHADRAAGRPMEIDARNGVIVRLGGQHGIPTPYNHMAVTLLDAMARV